MGDSSIRGTFMSPGYKLRLEILYHKINSLVIKNIIYCTRKKTYAPKLWFPFLKCFKYQYLATLASSPTQTLKHLCSNKMISDQFIKKFTMCIFIVTWKDPIYYLGLYLYNLCIFLNNILPSLTLPSLPWQPIITVRIFFFF